MKVSTQLLATGAIAFTATALAMPSMTKRVVDGTKVIGCLASVFMKGEEAWTPECAAAAATDIGFIRELSLADMSIDFTGPNPSILGFSSSGANAKLIPIPGVNYLVKEVANHFTLIDDGVELVKMESPSAPAEVKGNVVKTAVENTALKIIPGQEDGFSKFIEAVLSRPTYTLTINGNVDVKGQIPGTSAASSKLLTLTNIGVSSSFTLRCMGSSVQIEHVKLVSLTEDADSGAVTLVHDINIHNPSQLNLKLGDSAFHLLNADGVLVGVANIPNFNLAMGDNVMTSTVKFTDSDTYNALTTTSNTFTVVGFDGSTKNPILTKAMGAFKSQITIPKLEAA